MTQGAWVLVAVLVAATGFGLLRAARDGRFRGTHLVRGAASEPGPEVEEPAEPSVLDGADIEHELGERATLLQFSSAFCAPCRATRRVLTEVADIVPGVRVTLLASSTRPGMLVSRVRARVIPGRIGSFGWITR